MEENLFQGHLSVEEKEELLVTFNSTEVDFSLDKTIMDLFQEQAERTPDNVAVVFGEKKLSYKELDEISNQLGRYLQKNYEINADDLVGIKLVRNEWMLISILGVLKSGGAYVPIDPEYPHERIEYIEKDTKCKVCIDEEQLNKFRKNKAKYEKTRVTSLTKSENLAYVIYTSGSTGRPKGVMIEHRNVVNYLKWYTENFNVVPTDTTMAYAKFGFDASVGETLTYLTKGACVHIAPQELLLDVEGINKYYESNNITIAFLPTPVCEQFMHLKNKSLRCLTTGGDRLNQFVENGYQLINNYGPTETTVVSTTYKVNESKSSYPIGKPIYNTEVHILGESLNLLPIGITGEICIGGAGLARGYLNQDIFTNEKFIPHPFKEGAKLYKTGDLGRWLADGNIEFISRKDDQVKINGYRIELGEIESAMSQIEGVKQACVLVKEKKTASGSNKYLVGYFVLDTVENLPNSTAIKNKLSKVLPEYMIPGVFVEMKSFPLTTHGKLNKHALPEPDHSISEEYVAPITEKEIAICTIWQNLLSVERIGICDEFFRIGGNSILAMQASYKMSKVLECDVKVADIFKYKTISKLLIYCIGKTQTFIPKTDANIAMLSFAQERLWFIEQYEEGTNAYFIPQVFELDEETNKEGLKYALRKIVTRHQILRSTIEKGDEGFGLQRVHDKPIVIEDIVLADWEDYKSTIITDINHPFDLSCEYPIRIKFYTFQTDKATIGHSSHKSFLLINTHHIANDGWSVDVFQKELRTYYEAYLNNDLKFDLPSLEIQYKDYALWQNAYLTGEVLEKKLSYWKEKLLGYQMLEFPSDYVRPTRIDYKGESKRFSLSKEVSKKLRVLAQENGVTLHSVMLACTNILLSKYTGQDDIVTGSPSAGRNHQQTETLIGFFVNAQVNRSLLGKSQSFLELIHQVHEEQIESQLHQDLPFEKLVDELVHERDVSRNPIFQIMFGVQNFDNAIHYNDRQVTYLKPFYVENSYEVEQFDLSIFFNDGEANIVGTIGYQTSLFRESSIESIINHFVYLFEQLTHATDKPYSQISLLNSQEYDKLVVEWNETGRDYQKTKTIHRQFEEQVKKTPDAIAIVFEGNKLTYKELNEKSNQLANHIRKEYKSRIKRSISTDSLVALCLDRSLEMIIGILAVMKAGGAYVPIDPYYPQERIDFILEDTQSELILTQRSLTGCSHIPDSKARIVYIDLVEELYKCDAILDLQPYSKSTDLAYVIYTSGTTGNPKGVLIEHHSVINLVNFHNNRYCKFWKNLSIALVSNYNFDSSVQQMFNAILYGHTLHVISKELILDPFGFNHYLLSNEIEVFDMTPSLFFHLVLPFDNYQNSQLKIIIIGGENLASNIITEFFKKKLPSQILIFNNYGPTESTVDAATFEIDCKSKMVYGSGSVLIGKPIDNTKIYVLDENYMPVPTGIVGELYVSGLGLARGYLNRPDLTAQRFIVNPFATEEDKAKGYSCLYKTGDLVRWLIDGNLECIGRNDDQVKINGYRIELGEIENALTQIKGIRQVCVLVKEKKAEVISSKYLVAYYVKEKDNDSYSEADILEKLSLLLPEYMLPNAIIAMESFPLTVNGKLDKRALPDANFSSLGSEYVAPVNEIEARLCNIYSEVLGLASDQISTHQNFFKMGGNSILSIQLKHKLNQQKEFKHISVADLFKYNSIHKLISSIEHGNTAEYKLQNNLFKNDNQEIAIIGISGAFSGAKDISELWKLISNQQEGVRLYSKEECKYMGVDEALLENDDFIPVAGMVKDIELFDPLFWGLSPNEAKVMDPQIRKFIEHCWFALESSGYAQERKRFHIGVFAGSGDSNYFYDNILNGEASNQINMWDASNSNNKDALVTKTAFLLGLTGPANSVNTACSTSLVAVAEACQKLQLGICDMALAGGVSLSLPNKVGYIYQKGMILSKDGHCKTFDSEASGTISGSGVGVVLLKRLKDAVKDNDNIIGVIKGYAINNDGDRKTGYTAPSIIGQSECIINAQRMAGITSDLIDYVECHGTATHLGDPIEVQALKEAFVFNHSGKSHLNHKTVLGAVKANIGHTDSAAGIAGLIKVCTMLQNNFLTGQANFNTPNSELHLDQANFEIIKKNRTWLPSINKQRLACVSSFGVGGTNAHMIISDYSIQQSKNNHTKDNLIYRKEGEELFRFIIPISAKSRKALEQYKKVLLSYLTETDKTLYSYRISDIAYTLQERREQFNYRSAYNVNSISELITQLKSDIFFEEANIENKNKLVFMFPGQGVQYANMAHELYKNELFFKSVIDDCIKIANEHLSVNLFDVIYPGEKQSVYDINEIQWSPISLFIVEYALAKYLEYLGVQADAYIGHSFGEYAAATLAGVFSLEDAIKVVITRGKLMQLMEPGGMLAINATRESVNEILKANNCEIAVVNSREDIVASGDKKAIEMLQDALENLSIPVVKINGSVAGHSKLMDNAVVEFEKVFKNIKLNKPKKIFASNLTGVIASEEVVTAKYWCNQLRHTVQFAKGINALSTYYNHQVSFIEVGAGKGLSYFVDKYVKDTGHKSIQTSQLLPSANKVNDSQGCQNMAYKEDVIAKLWMSGVVQKPNEISLFKHARLETTLPSYQFDYQKMWLEKGQSSQHKKFNSIENMFYKRSWERADLKSVDGIKNIKYKNVLVLVNDKKIENNNILLDVLSDYYGNINYVIHQYTNNIRPEVVFDFSNASDIINIFNEKKSARPIDIVIYVSSSIDIDNPGLDVFAVKNIFDWSKDTGNKIPKFISISFDNYEVVGSEILQEKPSIVYGVTKSIPFEYFTSGTQTFHIDLSSQDRGYKDVLLSVLEQNNAKDLIVLRGKYQWLPTYIPINVVKNKVNTDSFHANDSVFVITGGLGGIGYAYANYIMQKDKKCTLILLGRTSESNLRDDYKIRLSNLRQSQHTVIYSSIDIGHTDALDKLNTILVNIEIKKIDMVLHAAGVGAKSALREKSHDDINQVLGPKTIGLDNLIRLAVHIPINVLACCSSGASIIPSLGNMEYTAANLFIDEMGFRKHKNINHIYTLNLNQISDTGMLLDFIEQLTAKHGPSSDSFKSFEFPIIMEMLLSNGIERDVVFSRYDFNEEYRNYIQSINSQDTKSKNVSKIRLIETEYTNTEFEIAQIFGEVLGLEQISIYDDFFKLGGNSILAIRVSHRISEVLATDIRIADLFKYKTANKLKEILSKDSHSENIKREKWKI